MDIQTIKVYVKVNENNEITQINSSIFLTDTTDWILIDEGYGDKYAHAQGNYLEKGIRDEQGRYNYKLVDGVVVEIPEEEKPEIKPEAPSASTEERIATLEKEIDVLLGMEV